MTSAGIPPAMNGSAFELGNYDLEEGEILFGEIPVILTSSPKVCATEELFPYMDDKINYLLGNFQKIFGDRVAKEGSKLWFNQYGSFLVACPRQSSSLSKSIVRDTCIPVAPTLNNSRAKNSALTLNGLRERNAPKGLLRNKHMPTAPTVNIYRERNNICASDGLREEKNGPKKLLKDKTVPAAPAVNVSRERNNTCTSELLRERRNGPKNLLKHKPVKVAPAINNSREINNTCTSDGLKEKKNESKGLLKDKPISAAPVANNSRKRNNLCTSDELKENNNGPKGLQIDKHVHVAPSVNVLRERKSASTSDGQKEKNKNRHNVLVGDNPAPAAPTVNISRARKSRLPSARLSEKNNVPNSQNIQIGMEPNSPKDVYQILKEFELPLEAMLSPLPNSLLCLKESDCQPRKGLESNDKEDSMNQKEINPSPKESKIFKMKKLKDLVEKVSEGKPNETLELLPFEDKSPSAGEPQKNSTNGINNTSVQDDVINDSWVCCDKCQKWRLLPIDINPSLLPEKWICSMLSWMSGMNRCSVTENETTEAVRALCKTNTNRASKDESLTKVRPLKRKRKLIIDNDDEDDHSEGQVFKALKPCSVEANNVESKVHKSPSADSEQCNFIRFPGKGQIPPEQMISDGKKRKMNFEEADQSNSGNKKKAKVSKKVTRISAPLENAPPLPRRNTSYKDVGAKSSAAGKKFSMGKNCKPEAALSSDRYGKLRRMVLKRKTQREKGFALLNERKPILLSQNSLRIKRGINRPKFIENCGSQRIISAFEEATKLHDHADRMKAKGLEREGTSISFDAALKFLQVASLLEPEVTENGNFVGATEHSITMYSDAAKIFGLCAEEYVKCGEMGVAVLAYKCTEVAYMRIVFIKHSTSNASQQECKRFPCLVPTVSELDNMTSQCNYNSSHCHQDIQSLLNTAHDMNHAMEASRKAVSAYNHMQDRISSVKRALNVSFHDIDCLLDLVRVSKDAITHPSSSHH